MVGLLYCFTYFNIIRFLTLYVSSRVLLCFVNLIVFCAFLHLNTQILLSSCDIYAFGVLWVLLLYLNSDCFINYPKLNFCFNWCINMFLLFLSLLFSLSNQQPLSISFLYGQLKSFDLMSQCCLSALLSNNILSIASALFMFVR